MCPHYLLAPTSVANFFQRPALRPRVTFARKLRSKSRPASVWHGVSASHEAVARACVASIAFASCTTEPPPLESAPSSPQAALASTASEAGLDPPPSDSEVPPTPTSPPVALASASPAASDPKPPDPNRFSFARPKQAEVVSGSPPPGGFANAAATCLAEASCSIERYAGLFFAAVDASEAVPCFQLVDGVGVPVDLARARKCLEASVKREGDCGKSSPSLDRLQLALLIATGRGGARSSAGAREAMQSCFQDGSVSAVDDVIVGLEKGKNPSLDSIQVCEAGIAGTTLHMSACLMLEIEYLDVRESALEKALSKTFDATTLAAFRAAGAENRKYATAYAENAADLVRGGTMAQTMYPGAILTARSARLLRWEQLTRGVLTDVPAPKAARADVLAKRDAARAKGDAMFKGYVAKMEKAYAAYRAKEAPLFKTLPTMTAARVDALLDVEWSEELDIFGLM